MGRKLDAERFSAAPRKRHFIIEMQGIEYHANAPCVGRHFLEQLYPLAGHFIGEKGDAGEVHAWPGKRDGNSRPHRAIADATDDRYAAFTCLEQRLDNVTANGEQKGRLLRDKFGGQFRKSIRHTIGIADDDFDVAAIDEAGLFERILQRLIDRSQFGVAKYQPSDPGQ